MKSYTFERFFKENNIQFRKDEGYPVEFSQLEVTDVYYIPAANLVLDVFDILNPETAKQLELSGYPVFLVKAVKDLTYIFQQHGVSLDSF